MGIARRGMNLDESLPGTAVREVKEETGYDIEVTGQVGTYTPAARSHTRTVRSTGGSMAASKPVCPM